MEENAETRNVTLDVISHIISLNFDEMFLFIIQLTFDIIFNLIFFLNTCTVQIYYAASYSS